MTIDHVTGLGNQGELIPALDAVSAYPQLGAITTAPTLEVAFEQLSDYDRERLADAWQRQQAWTAQFSWQ